MNPTVYRRLRAVLQPLSRLLRAELLPVLGRGGSMIELVGLDERAVLGVESGKRSLASFGSHITLGFWAEARRWRVL